MSLFTIFTRVTISLFLITPLWAATTNELKTLAKTYPAMPRGSADMARFVGGLPTFSSGSPFNDLEFTLIDTDYIDGENAGHDTFMPVDPSDPVPGANRVKYVRCALNTDLDQSYGASAGDRIILGTHEISQPFFSKGSDGIDNDYAVIQHFDYEFGHIQLKGQASDYQLVYVTIAEGAKTDGWYLFYTAGSSPDLIAFIFPVDAIEPAVSGNPPMNTTPYGPSGSTLSLTNPIQFRYASALSLIPTVPGGVAQVGSSGKEIVYGMTADEEKNTYLVGCTDGNLDGGPESPHEIMVIKVSPAGQRLWVSELAMQEGSILKGAVTDNDYLYVCGRTLGALSGFTNVGRWDGIILKLRRSDGVIVATNQWGNPGIDGYGNIVLDGAGHLFVSGQGAPAGPATNDDAYLVAKHRTSDLSNVWRQIDSVEASGFKASAEAWGGLTYVPSPNAGASLGEGRLIVAGWYITNGGANAFASIYENLTASTPTRPYNTVVASTGTRAEWILDSAVDAQGRVYFVGYTTGSLQGTQIGEGDAFLVRYSSTLTSPVYRQFGTARSDMASRVEIDAQGNLHVLGYTYGNYASQLTSNAGPTGDIFVETFDANFNSLRKRQFGSDGEDRGLLKLVGDDLIIGGMTESSLVGSSHGSFDGFVIALDRRTLELSSQLPTPKPFTLQIKNPVSPQLYWPVLPGKRYQLFHTNDLVTWLPLESEKTPPFGVREMIYQVPSEHLPRTFYRATEQ